MSTPHEPMSLSPGQPDACPEGGDRLSGYLDGAVSEAEAAAIADHLEICPVCRAELDDVRRAKRAVEAHAWEIGHPPAPSALIERLAAARARTAEPGPRLRRPTRPIVIGALASTLAAGLLILVAIRAVTPPPADVAQAAQEKSASGELEAAAPESLDQGLVAPPGTAEPPPPAAARQTPAPTREDDERRELKADFAETSPTSGLDKARGSEGTDPSPAEAPQPDASPLEGSKSAHLEWGTHGSEPEDLDERLPGEAMDKPSGGGALPATEEATEYAIESRAEDDAESARDSVPALERALGASGPAKEVEAPVELVDELQALRRTSLSPSDTTVKLVTAEAAPGPALGRALAILQDAGAVPVCFDIAPTDSSRTLWVQATDPETVAGRVKDLAAVLESASTDAASAPEGQVIPSQRDGEDAQPTPPAEPAGTLAQELGAPARHRGAAEPAAPADHDGGDTEAVAFYYLQVSSPKDYSSLLHSLENNQVEIDAWWPETAVPTEVTHFACATPAIEPRLLLMIGQEEAPGTQGRAQADSSAKAYPPPRSVRGYNWAYIPQGDETRATGQSLADARFARESLRAASAAPAPQPARVPGSPASEPAPTSVAAPTTPIEVFVRLARGRPLPPPQEK